MDAHCPRAWPQYKYKPCIPLPVIPLSLLPLSTHSILRPLNSTYYLRYGSPQARDDHLGPASSCSNEYASRYSCTGQRLIHDAGVMNPPARQSNQTQECQRKRGLAERLRGGGAGRVRTI